MSISARKFTRLVLQWSEAHPRPLPWKDTSDPYKIWVSEIILQQTQVSQGLPYYHAFIKRFPTVRKLANASEDQVLHAWQGLGYNLRARNMHAAANAIMREHRGVFPNTYEEILALKGVGEYTAAAIASFAFGLPYPVLDSNVIRVLCRVWGVADDPLKSETRKSLYGLLDRLIEGADPAAFNQAIMNFGAIQCTAHTPDCKGCPIAWYCQARKDDLVDTLPIRAVRNAKKVRYFHYFVLRNPDGIILHKRTKKDIWQHMYELPMIETQNRRMPSTSARRDLFKAFGITRAVGVTRVLSASQTLSHQVIQCTFYDVRAQRFRRALLGDCRFEFFENLETFAYPKVVRAFFHGQFSTFNENGRNGR